jgi:hypothetical protein
MGRILFSDPVASCSEQWLGWQRPKTFSANDLTYVNTGFSAANFR